MYLALSSLQLKVAPASEVNETATSAFYFLVFHDPGFTLSTYMHLIDKGLGDADFLDQVVGSVAV